MHPDANRIHCWTMRTESPRMTRGYHHKADLPVTSQSESPPGHSYLAACNSTGPHAFPQRKRKHRKSAVTATCSISALLEATSTQVNTWGRYELQNILRCVCGFLSIYFTTAKALHNSVITEAFDEPKSCFWLPDTVIFYADTAICPSENFTALSWISMIYNTCC